MESTDDSIIVEKGLIILVNHVAFLTNQSIIHELGGISIIEKNSVNHSIKKKVLNKLNNLNVNVEN